MKLLPLKAALVSFIATASADTLQEICGGITGLYNCKAKITIPVGVEPVMKTVPSFKYNSCKTKSKYTWVCGTLLKPKTCRKEICVPGTEYVEGSFPIGIKVVTKRFDICEAIRSDLGNVGEEFISKSTTMCACGPKALQLMANGFFKSVQSGTDTSAAVMQLAKDLASASKCFLDNGFKIQENVQELRTTGDLAPQGGWVTVEAPEIGIDSYIELIAAISPCFTSACNPDLIRAFFTNYLSRANEQISEQVSKILTGWLNVFDRISVQINATLLSVDDFFDHLATIPNKTEEIKNRVCQKNACLGPVINDFFNRTSEAFAVAIQLKDVKTAVGGAIDTFPKLIELVNTAIEALEDLPDADDIIEMILSGKLNKIAGILEVIKVTKSLPILVQDLEKNLVTVVGFVTKYVGRIDQVEALFQDVVSTAWNSYPYEFTTDSSGNVRAGLNSIQDLIRSEVQVPFDNVTSNFYALQESVTTLPFSPDRFALKADVASYQRWSDLKTNLPCSKWVTQKFNLLGFSTTFSYPKFWACWYEETMHWPNHHIPYFKLRV